MEKKFIGIPQVVIETDDIEHLSQKACEQLKCGDIVVKVSSNGTKKHCYQVVYKKDTELCFVYCDYETIEEIYYEKGDSGWAFGEKHIRTFAEEVK